MTESEWKNLKVGNRIKFVGNIESTGTIVSNSKHFVIVRWDGDDFEDEYDMKKLTISDRHIIENSVKD